MCFSLIQWQAAKAHPRSTTPGRAGISQHLKILYKLYGVAVNHG